MQQKWKITHFQQTSTVAYPGFIPWNEWVGGFHLASQIEIIQDFTQSHNLIPPYIQQMISDTNFMEKINTWDLKRNKPASLRELIKIY